MDRRNEEPRVQRPSLSLASHRSVKYEKRVERQDPWTCSRGFDSGFSLVEQLLVDGRNLI